MASILQKSISGQLELEEWMSTNQQTLGSTKRIISNTWAIERVSFFSYIRSFKVSLHI